MTWENNYLNFKNQVALESLRANELRQKSFEQFTKLGLPTKKEEAWKFTSLNSFKEIEWFVPLAADENLSHEQLLEVSKHLPSDFLNFVFVNGQLNKTLSDDFDNLLEITEPTESDFDCNNVEVNLLNLAHAFLNKKINLKISKSKTIEKPIHILFVQLGKKSYFISERLHLELEENSEVKVIVNSIDLTAAAPQALNLNITVNSQYNSRLQLIQLQNQETQSFNFSQAKLNLGASAHVSTLALNLGSALSRSFLQLAFDANNAEAQVYGVAVIDGQQHMDNYTFIQHSKGENQSVQQYKSILSGSAHSVFRGRVLIEPNAQKANSEQLNNNLLLTRTAQADSIPQLEIFADDVKAGHGATVGQLNKDEIFYFLSRGINQFQAVKMLSYGFATELILKFESKLIQDYLISALNKKLENMVQNA